MSRLSRLTSRHPRWVIAAVAVLTLLGFAVSGVVSSRLTNSNSDYADAASSSAQARTEVLRATGIDLDEGYTALVTLPAPASLSAAPPAVVTDTVRLLRSRPEVVAVTDAWSAHLPSLISSDGRSAVVAASVRQVNEDTADHALQAQIDADPALRGRVLLGGSTALDAQASDQSLRDLSFAEGIAIPVLLVLLVVIFGSVVAGMLPLLGAVVSVALTLLLMLVAVAFTQLSIYSLNLVYALGIGLSIDFSLLIVSRYREEMDRLGPGAEALGRTLGTAGRTVLFSAATVTAALGALLLFPIPAISSMGLAGMMVTVCSAFSAVVVLPSALTLLGPRVDALPLLRRRRRPAGESAGGFWWRLSRGVMRRPAVVGAVAVLGLLAAGSPALGVAFTGYSTRELPASLPGTRVATALTSDFSGVGASPLQLIVSGGASAAPRVDAYAAAVAAVPGVQEVSPSQQLSPDLWEIDASLRGAGLSEGALSTLARVRALPAGLPVRSTGYTASFADEEASLGSHLPLAAGLLALTTLLILLLMTGSAVLPFLALLMNMLTLTATLGLVVLVFQHGVLSGVLGFTSDSGINIETPVLAGALAFGLSTDYGVFLLGRIGEAHRSGLRTREAVALGLQRVGRVVTSAALLFFIAIGALVLSTTLVLKEIGLSAALAVVIDASVVRALLVPALMALLGRTSWWAPRWLTALHRRLAVERAEGEPEPATA